MDEIGRHKIFPQFTYILPYSMPNGVLLASMGDNNLLASPLESHHPRPVL
jgi:hypothetical protein